MNFNEIITKFKSKDKDSIELVYKNISRTIYLVCKKYSYSKYELDDFIQDSYIKITTVIDKFKGDDFNDLNKWVRVVIRNFCIDKIRKKKKEFDSLPKQIEEVIIEDENLPEITELLVAIEDLKPRYKEVFKLFMIENLTHSEIDKKLNLNKGTSKANLYKAKIRIREIINSNRNKSI